MKQKKPKINSVDDNTQRVDYNKTNKAQASRFCSTAAIQDNRSHHRRQFERQYTSPPPHIAGIVAGKGTS